MSAATAMPTEADQELTDRFYGEVDDAMRRDGPFEFARSDEFFRTSRAAIACDVDWSELHRVVARITGFESWYSAWAASGEKFAGL